MMRKILLSALFALGVIISAILEKGVASKHYFTLSFTGALLIYWIVEMILSYIEFRKSYEKKYKIYKVKLLNSTNLSLNEIEREDDKYYKRFKRTMLKDSASRICLIAGLAGLFIAVIVTIIV